VIDFTNGFLAMRSSVQVNVFSFQLLIPGLTSVSQLESRLGFELMIQLADTGKRPSSHL
jgi:hypothetical protein